MSIAVPLNLMRMGVALLHPGHPFASVLPRPGHPAVMQECWGGEDDGKRVWSGFDFHQSGFFHEQAVNIAQQCATTCQYHAFFRNVRTQFGQCVF